MGGDFFREDVVHSCRSRHLRSVCRRSSGAPPQRDLGENQGCWRGCCRTVGYVLQGRADRGRIVTPCIITGLHPNAPEDVLDIRRPVRHSEIICTTLAKSPRRFLGTSCIFMSSMVTATYPPKSTKYNGEGLVGHTAKRGERK